MHLGLAGAACIVQKRNVGSIRPMGELILAMMEAQMVQLDWTMKSTEMVRKGT